MNNIVINGIIHPIRAFRYIVKKLQVIRVNYLDNKVNSQWHSHEYIVENITSTDVTLIYQYPTCSEVEHQIGRFSNMKKIMLEIERDATPGSVVEFGTWKGLGLILLSFAFQSNERPVQFVGIDSFEGLPESSTIWSKGTFKDTSYDLALKNISTYINKKHHFSLVKGWFSDERVAKQLYKQVDDIVLIHFDADLGSSTKEALYIVEKYLLNLNHPIYFLFDDWGCHPDEVPDAFYEWLNEVSDKYKLLAEKLYSTRYTRYYKITVVR